MANEDNTAPEGHETPREDPIEHDAEAVQPEADEVQPDAAEPAADEAHVDTAPREEASASVTPTGTVATQRQLVRERAAQVKARQTRMRWIRRSAIAVVVVAVVAAVAVLVTSIISGASSRPELEPAGIENDGIPVTAAGASFPSNAGGGVPTGNKTPTPTATATPTVDPSATPAPTPQPVDIVVYVDYLSPESAVFQMANAAQLADLVRMGSATLTYHPVATLAAKSNGTKYSLRATAAVACVSTFSPDTFYAYNYELFAQQPEQDADGLSDDQLADIAIAVGSRTADSVRNCIEKGTYLSWAKTATDRALETPIEGLDTVLEKTPTILVNGVAYVGALDNPAELLQAVMSAESKAVYGTATPTPTPEATPTADPSATPDPATTETPAATPEPTTTP